MNPFIEAYQQSDLLGKLIFLALYALSACSWIVLLYKLWVTHQVKCHASRFQEAFFLHKQSPLQLELESLEKRSGRNPFVDLYKTLKKHTLELLAKNNHFQQLKTNAEGRSFLCLSDIDFLSAHLSSKVASSVKDLEKHLYLLATTVSLAPFLGLLGTVWGILTTFSAMQSGGGAALVSQQAILGGISLALATTVLGLVNAIPALIGYNYLKNAIRDFTTDMEGFSNHILAAVELQYRKVDT